MGIIFSLAFAMILSLLSSTLIGGCWGMLIILLFVIVSAISPITNRYSVIIASGCGFFWDLYSPGIFGIHFVGLLVLSLIIGQVVTKIIQVPQNG